MTQVPKLSSGWTCPISWPSTKPFQMSCHVNYYKKKMNWEESAMLSISTSNTPNRSKNTHKHHFITWTILIERTKVRNHIDKLVPIHLVSTFPPFPEMHLLIQPVQFSIHSLYDVTNTLNNPINLFKTLSKVCHFFSISSSNFINSNNQSR